MHLIRQLNQEQGKTVIYVTHDPRMAEFADRTIHLLDGIIHREEINDGKPVAELVVPAQHPE
jgi:putative ABC transport system ATP-binding protein